MALLKIWAQGGQRLANQFLKRGRSRLHRPLLVLLFLISTAIALLARPLLAAVLFNYFTVVTYPTVVSLEWSTASEVNVAGFDVLYKPTDEDDEAYHPIAFVPARGGPGVGALYELPVTDLAPGVAYCFRLTERTTDGSNGEKLDRCGYGPGVTPTPGAPGVIQTRLPGQILPAAQATLSPLVNPNSPLPPPLAPVIDPNTGLLVDPITRLPVTPTPFQPPVSSLPGTMAPVIDPNTGLLVDPITRLPVTPTPFQPPFSSPLVNPISPLPPPLAPVIDPSTGLLVDPITRPPVTPTPFQPPVSSLPGTLPPVIDPNTGLLVDPITRLPVTPTPFQPPVSSSPVAVAPESLALAAPPGQPVAPVPELAAPPVAAVAAPTAVQYLVVTATPTAQPLALAPVLTPLATVTPVPATFQVASLLQPSAQNLMVMLLCLTFTGATGIGIIGLVTSVLFIRSRSSQRDFYDRHNGRRRTF